LYEDKLLHHIADYRNGLHLIFIFESFMFLFCTENIL